MTALPNNKGSEWRKWDLHVHTPSTKLSDNYRCGEGEDILEKFCDEIEASDVCVIGITDYFSADNYFSFIEKFRSKYPQSDKVFFPNIELRLEVSVNRTAEEVNIHIIFSEDVTKEEIDSFLEKLDTNITRNGATISCKNLGTSDFVSAGINYTKIRECLQGVFGHRPCYLIFAAANNAGLRPDTNSPRKLNVSDEIDKMCDGFFGGDQNVQYYLDEDRYEAEEKAKNKPVISGSDVHSFEDITNWLGKRSTRTEGSEEIIEKDVCWIKSEATFEGLKQIAFDPESRVSIGERSPVTPTNVIESISFNVPEDAKITVEQNDGTEKEESFCFAGVNSTYQLSPFFNCFIGGRGSGKSTVLNFMGQHSKDSSSSDVFWKKLRPSLDTKDRNIFSFSGVEQFEFIGQSEVESFASNKDAFTSAIYERANILSGGSLQTKANELSDLLITIEGFESLITSLSSSRNSQIEKEKEKRTLEQSIKIASSKEYSEIVAKITKKSNDKQYLETWRTAVESLRDSINQLEELQSSADENEDGGSSNAETSAVGTSAEEAPASVESEDIALPYKQAYENAKKNIASALTSLKRENFETLVEKENSLAGEIEVHEKELSDLLEKAGLSPENILQIKSAPQKLVKIEDELSKLKKKIDETEIKLKEYSSVLAKAQSAKSAYERAIEDSIKPLVVTLEEQAKENEGKDIKNIGLRYFFDESTAWAHIAHEFYAYFPQYQDGERSEDIKNHILQNKNFFSGGRSDLIAHLESLSGSQKYVRFLKEVFGIEENFQIFCTMRDKHLNDVSQYKQIQVLYDGKDIERASFGQKCTAVMVILLLFGNYPLIIDEPEAHLDSSLIANYLVPLIKKKKTNRQIIFATHNANFVVNGDAEKIFILKNETGRTTFTETTIENLDHREELLKLEGGREAFRKRGEKLHI